MKSCCVQLCFRVCVVLLCLSIHHFVLDCQELCECGVVKLLGVTMLISSRVCTSEHAHCAMQDLLAQSLHPRQ